MRGENDFTDFFRVDIYISGSALWWNPRIVQNFSQFWKWIHLIGFLWFSTKPCEYKCRGSPLRLCVRKDWGKMEHWNIFQAIRNERFNPKKNGDKKSRKVFTQFFLFWCWQIELESSIKMYILLLAISGFCFTRKKI